MLKNLVLTAALLSAACSPPSGNGAQSTAADQTDPAAPADFVAFCKATGNALMDSGQRGEAFYFVIRRAAAT